MENLEAVVGVVVNDEVSVVVADLEFPRNHFLSLFLAFSQSLCGCGIWWKLFSFTTHKGNLMAKMGK